MTVTSILSSAPGSFFFFFSSRRRHTRCLSDWSSDVCSSDLTLVYAVPLQQDERVIGAAVVLLDAQFLELSEWDLWRRTAVRLGVLMLLLTGITWLVVRWSVTRPMARIAEWTRHLKSGQPLAPPPEADAGLFGSLATEGTGLARTLARAPGSAAGEARLRLTGESLWTEERLKQFVEIRFGERPIFIVSHC